MHHNIIILPKEKNVVSFIGFQGCRCSRPEGAKSLKAISECLYFHDQIHLVSSVFSALARGFFLCGVFWGWGEVGGGVSFKCMNEQRWNIILLNACLFSIDLHAFLLT